MPHQGPTTSARLGVVLLVIMVTLVTPESAQLFVFSCLAVLVAGDRWWERRGARRLVVATMGYPPGRHRESKQPLEAVLR